MTIMRDEWYQRSIKNTYTTAPIQEIFKRAEANKKLIVGVIGGSITAGANASDFQQTAYAPLVVQWFRKKFPQTEIHFVNAECCVQRAKNNCRLINTRGF